MREKREKETVSHARLGFNTKSNTLDTANFAFGESIVFIIHNRWKINMIHRGRGERINLLESTLRSFVL